MSAPRPPSRPPASCSCAAAHHKPAKDAIAIITMPTRSVAVAMLIAGFVSMTKTAKMPRRIRITAERKTTLLVSLLILFSNGTQGVELDRHNLGRRLAR
jgi:hypothetical protein